VKGLQILREDLAKFEIKYSKKLRLETTALTILVRPDSKLEDINLGKVTIEGIMGPPSFTILNNEVDTVHQAELKPNKQIDRKRLSLLTNIWTVGITVPGLGPLMFIARLTTGVNRHLVSGRTGTLDDHL
jgi:hypothetical protein